jgi:hypothetical protein
MNGSKNTELKRRMGKIGHYYGHLTLPYAVNYSP